MRTTTTLRRRHPWAALGLIALIAFAATPVRAGEQAERALAAVRNLIAGGEVKPDAVLKVAFKPGNINALLGPDLEIQRDWEQRTGIRISAKVIPQQPALTNLKDNPDIDITVARTHEFPDLLAQNLVTDLTPLLRRFGFKLAGGEPDGYVRPRLQGYFGERMVAVPADGDIALFYVRRDLLDSPAEKAAFRKATGHVLAPPVTWEDYDRQVAFFHRPEQDLYGSAEQRDRDSGWMMWLPRYYQQNTPSQRLFDAQLRPLIDSPAGIAATESYLRTVRHAPPEILGEGKDYSYTMPMFMQGKAYAISGTIAAAKLFNSPGSAVRGKFLPIPIPATRIGKTLVRNNTPIYGNNLIVSRRSTQAPLALLFTLWLTDPDNSLRTVGVRGGHTDPFRWHHLRDPRVVDLYTTDALRVFKGEWAAALPPGTGLPADGEYLDALNRQIWLAARGEQTAAEAMRNTAEAWERITERLGRDQQIAAQKIFDAGFAANAAQRDVQTLP